MNFKIVCVFFAAFIVVSVTIYFYIDLLVNIYDPSWRGIRSLGSKHTDTEKIFIIGSSSVYSINSTYVQNYLSERGSNYEVYNLAYMSDLPSTRINTLHNIISNKPLMVVYGIGIADFQKIQDTNSRFSSDHFSTYVLNPHEFFIDFISYISNYDTAVQFPSSPKDRTILLLKYFISGPEYVYHPFINFKKSPINDYQTLKTMDSDNSEFGGIDISKNNKERVALETIVTELHKQGIGVVLFANPNHRIYLDGVSDLDKSNFEYELKNISKSLNTNVYFLHEKYADMNIWRDTIHIAVDPKAKIFTEDIARIIQEELEK